MERGGLHRLIGHRGAAAQAPENTLASIRLAVGLGVSRIEFDVRLTADGHPVVIHDHTLARTTDGHGYVARRPLAEIRRLDAGSWFAPGFAGEPVPTLDEVLVLLVELGVAASIEIKPARGDGTAEAAAVLAALSALGPQRLPAVVISSFSIPCLAAVKARAPWVPRALALRRPGRGWRRSVEELEVCEIHCSQRALTPRTLRRLKAAGLPIAAFTVDDPARARALLAAGVDLLFSNLPPSLLRAVAQLHDTGRKG